MANMIGMNVEEVRALAGTFEQKAGELDNIISTVESKLGATTWVGKDADQFRNDWNSRLKPDLKRAAEELRKAAGTAKTNATAQENTSNTL
ncbi:MAG: WXG100 family type VII secretion target [Buchananella hordeovulneris]|nr:WXG100 family type VII secretion target [Buchananella hordeovulneris]